MTAVADQKLDLTQPETSAPVGKVVFWEKVVEFGKEPKRRGVITVDGIDYDITAKPAKVQRVPDDERMHEGWDSSWTMAIDKRHSPAKTKEDHIIRLIIDQFVKRRLAIAGDMWQHLVRLERLSGRIDDRATYEWRIAFDTTWRKLDKELHAHPSGLN